LSRRWAGFSSVSLITPILARPYGLKDLDLLETVKAQKFFIAAKIVH
jgi:hypothetical protein